MTYEELCSFEVLYKAYLEARKGKRSKSKTIEYEAQALACTEKLSRKLAVCNVRQPDGSIRQQIRYVPSKFEVFAVYEPKRRMVHVPAFVDKVVLHALVDNILYDALTKSFIRDSHASQTGKGTDDGLMRLKTHMVDYYRREGHGADGWVLKGDVRHFFASIDHRKLKRKLKAVLDKRGVDPRVYELLCIYIDVMEDGLPLGYQTSQLFALMFLDEFDHIIKEKYRIKYYGRYMDDFYIICSDKKKLQCILRDVRALMDSYGLELNQKTAIFPLRNGIDFLGFHSYLTDTGAVIQKLRRDTVSTDGAALGRKNVAFAWKYTVRDAEGDTLTVTEKLDGKTTKTRTGVASGTALTFEQTASAAGFQKILNGNHTITVEVSDGKETVSTSATFTKAVHAASVTLAEPLAVEGDITVAVLQVTGSIPDDAKFKAEVTNNALDSSPVWQDATTEVKKGVNIVFENKATTNGAAFNFRVSVERGESGTGGYIEAVSGAFQ